MADERRMPQRKLLPCPRCHTGGYKQVKAADERPLFICGHCGHQWTCGHTGGVYAQEVNLHG